MREWADFTIESEADGAQVVALAGPLIVSSVGELDQRLRGLAGPVARIDLAGVGAIDTVGAWIVSRLADEFGATVSGASKEARRLIAAVREKPQDEETGAADEQLSPLTGLLVRAGEFTMGYVHGVLELLGFLGALLIAAARALRHPSRIRWISLVRQIELVGVGALPIVGLMSFLIGIVIAQQGAVQLRQFGAEIYTVNLTGRLSFRELGILMTAIMFAGRSGSSFAAQIGTMKLTEEVDAMRTIGVSPMEALVLPRVMASVLIMPLLGFYSAVLAIIGGAFISMFALEIPFFTFLTRIQEVVPRHDLWVGLIKGPVFGLIVALAGCYQGMRVHGNSEEVGLKTTVAVVQAIFAVIVLDAFFAVFFTEVGWG
ncbi:ABC transporter permease [Novosphingobium sp.]|uniref:ABC transporter permease n=1 Tax=Novosphingobium sp. TaxID=1874826 RepID=UPI0025E07E55|nr:ABC transporter permease [Novosphingobium sp.]MCC6925002.1 ABC transporter permease [Novosphingobium sp.]